MSVHFPEITPNPLIVGQRTFIPEELLEEFMVDFVESYPESDSLRDGILFGTAIIGETYPYQQRGTWFHFNPNTEVFFMSDHKDGWFYTVPLEHVWTHCPTQQLPIPLNLDSIYS